VDPLASDLRATLLQLAASIGRQYVEVGRLLLQVRDYELFLVWGFPTLDAFTEATLRFKKDKCRYLMRIAAIVDRLHITAEELADIPWSKLLIVASLLTSANKAEWLVHVRTLSAQTLRAKVAVARGFAPPEEPLTAFVVRLSPSQRQTLEDALALGMQVAETTSRAVALVSIAQEAISSFAPLLAQQNLLTLPLSATAEESLEAQDSAFFRF